MRRLFSILCPLLLLATGCARQCPAPRFEPPRREGLHGLINPILDTESSFEFTELRPFKHKVERLITEKKRQGMASHVSMYFRDLNNGPIFGCDEKEKFAPASLLKVPLLLAALKRAEIEPAIMTRRLVYDIDELVHPNINQGVLTRGQEYSLDELLRAMIAHSDNAAALLVLQVIGSAAMEEVYRDLGFKIPEVRSPDDDMTVHEYSAFFRILYNASYLEKRTSQKALEYLAESEFKQGIVAGLPADIAVAHKFGERSTNDGKRQLHDCGIIYFPSRPYILCVMTRGDNFGHLAKVIDDISRLVYSEIKNQDLYP